MDRFSFDQDATLETFAGNIPTTTEPADRSHWLQ